MKILFIRHADPDYTIDSLTEKGFQEAQALAQRLKTIKIDHLYCSPLGRAQDTLKEYLKLSPQDYITCDWMREFDATINDPDDPQKDYVWDMQPSFWAKENQLYDKDDWINHDLFKNTDVKEKYDNVINNIDKLIEKHGYKREGNIYKAICPNEDTIAIFCHFGVECVMLSHILNISPLSLWHNFVACPSSVTTLATEERKEGIAIFRCMGFGDLSHLFANNQEPSFAARFCETYTNFKQRH